MCGFQNVALPAFRLDGEIYVVGAPLCGLLDLLVLARLVVLVVLGFLEIPLLRELDFAVLRVYDRHKVVTVAAVAGGVVDFGQKLHLLGRDGRGFEEPHLGP